MANTMVKDCNADEALYWNGQSLTEDQHFEDHIHHEVPIQIYWGSEHSDIGFIEQYCPSYVKVNNIFYKRNQFTFVSRPGY